MVVPVLLFHVRQFPLDQPWMARPSLLDLVDGPGDDAVPPSFSHGLSRLLLLSGFLHAFPRVRACRFPGFVWQMGGFFLWLVHLWISRGANASIPVPF